MPVISPSGGGVSQTLAQTLALGNSANSLKITSLANGTAATDMAAFGQIPVPSAGTVQRTAGDVTTVSTSFVDLTGASITMTTGARRVRLSFAGAWANSGPTGNGQYITFLVDGVNQGGTNGLNFMACPSNNTVNASFAFTTAVLTAASHTFKVQWRVSAGTGTMNASVTAPYSFSAVELLEAS